jgi:hypothetical protein
LHIARDRWRRIPNIHFKQLINPAGAYTKQR